MIGAKSASVNIFKPKATTASCTVLFSFFESQLKTSDKASFASSPEPTALKMALIWSSVTFSVWMLSRLSALTVSVRNAAMVETATPLVLAVSSKSRIYSESMSCLANFSFKPYCFIRRANFLSAGSGR